MRRGAYRLRSMRNFSKIFLKLFAGKLRSGSLMKFSSRKSSYCFPINVSNSFGGEDAANAGQVIGYADTRPVFRIEQRLHGGQGVVT
jgi:hypothetical protein